MQLKRGAVWRNACRLIEKYRAFLKGKQMRKFLVAAATLAAAGCSTYSSNVRVGNDMSYASLADQRAASMTVKVYDTLPPGAKVISKVDAGRCHRSFVEKSPAQEILLTDLKVAAYALGANGITDLKTGKQSALTKNCWYMLDGTATAISVPTP